MNQPRRLFAAILIASVATAVSGYVSGKLTKRWGNPREAALALELINNMPSQIGPWRFQGQHELSDDALEQLECFGYRNGGYLNTETGEVIQVSLIVGPYGPMSVHSPEICYPASGFRPASSKSREQLSPPRDSGATADFWVTTFQPRALGALPLRVYYSWFAYDKWIAPENARFAVGGEPAVFKLQVASRYDSAKDYEEEKDPCVRFIEDFLAEWSLLRSSLARSQTGPEGPPTRQRSESLDN